MHTVFFFRYEFHQLHEFRWHLFVKFVAGIWKFQTTCALLRSSRFNQYKKYSLLPLLTGIIIIRYCLHRTRLEEGVNGD